MSCFLSVNAACQSKHNIKVEEEEQSPATSPWAKVTNSLLGGIRKSTASRLKEEIFLLYSELVIDNRSAVSSERLVCPKTFLHIC